MCKNGHDYAALLIVNNCPHSKFVLRIVLMTCYPTNMFNTCISIDNHI